MIVNGVVCIFLALILYTLSIFIERLIGYLKLWIVILFASGFMCDLIGTSIMFYVSENKFSRELHSIFGYLALMIMCAHLIWAILAILKIEPFQKYFTKGSIYAWGAWMLAFITGIPKVSSVIVSWFI